VTSAVSGGWSAATLWAVFVVGLAGGFGHCIAMCGPLTAASALATGATRSSAGGRGRGRAGTIALWQAAYHGGRLLTYTAIGALLGALGSVWALRGVLGPAQRWVWLTAGMLMIVMGLAAAGAPLLGRLGRGLESGSGIATAGWFGRAFRWLAGRGAWAAVPLGMLNGLMPCGFLMSIEASALAAGSPGLGAATMLAFGLGTVPALAGFGAASGLLGVRGRAWLLYLGGAVVVALGAFYVLRAAGVAPGM
jgi:sulfite exporter TauE/SafE